MRFWVRCKKEIVESVLKQKEFNKIKEGVLEKQVKPGTVIKARLKETRWRGVAGTTLELVKDIVVWASKDYHRIVKNDLMFKELKKDLEKLVEGWDK